VISCRVPNPLVECGFRAPDTVLRSRLFDRGDLLLQLFDPIPCIPPLFSTSAFPGGGQLVLGKGLQQYDGDCAPTGRALNIAGATQGISSFTGPLQAQECLLAR
jgi:hypothetical protein